MGVLLCDLLLFTPVFVKSWVSCLGLLSIVRCLDLFSSLCMGLGLDDVLGVGDLRWVADWE